MAPNQAAHTVAVTPAAGGLVPSAGPPPRRYLHICTYSNVHTNAFFKRGNRLLKNFENNIAEGLKEIRRSGGTVFQC